MFESLTPMIVPAVLWLLVLFSILTWALLLVKAARFGKQSGEGKRFLRVFWAAPDLLSAVEHAAQYPGALARIAQHGIEAMSFEQAPRSTQQLAQSINRSERVERHLHQQIQKERRSLESGLTVLASIGSTAPFIGLFGTVWGIMDALKAIGTSGAASLETVAGPIGHALLATGVGIAVAVPAVLIYNYFLRRLKLSVAHMEDFSHDFHSLAQGCDFTIARQPVVQGANNLSKVG